jgi:shikimate kinase
MRVPIVLVGYRGSGKSTVGRLVAQALGRPFIDADEALAAQLGEPIATYLPRAGEEAFRDAESRCLHGILATSPDFVVATGGGVVLREANRTLIARAAAVVAYLQAGAATLGDRLAADPGGRPSLTGAGVAQEVPRLLAIREPLYQAVATVTLDAERPPADVAAALVDHVRAQELEAT